MVSGSSDGIADLRGVKGQQKAVVVDIVSDSVLACRGAVLDSLQGVNYQSVARPGLDLRQRQQTSAAVPLLPDAHFDQVRAV